MSIETIRDPADTTPLPKPRLSKRSVTRETFYLWPFQIGDQMIITRGRDQDEAYRGIERNLQRGVTVAFMDNMPTESSVLYGQNHDAGWLHRKPEWLK